MTKSHRAVPGRLPGHVRTVNIEGSYRETSSLHLQ